jgi:hypothetical protein
MAAVQLLMLTFLVFKVVATGAGMSPAPIHGGNSVARETTVEAQLQPRAQSLDGPSYLNEMELRRIIREELAAHAAEIAASRSAEKSTVAVASVREPGNKQQLDVINRQLNGYISAGVISESEMAALQGDLATLDNAGRKEILGKLVRAMNSGSLKGHF